VLSKSLIDRKFYEEFGLADPMVVRNGVDFEQWRTAPLAVRARWNLGAAPWLITVSNHAGVKRHERFFEVIKAVRRAIPSARGTLIGNSHRAETLGLGRFGVRGGCWYKCRLAALRTPGVTLRSAVPRGEVMSAVKEADILLVTSESEASPLVVLESMAAGTPWISLDVGCVRDHTGGVVVASRHEMADAAVRLLQDSAHREKLGAEGTALARSRHDWAHIVTGYEQMYRDLLSSRRPAERGA
jgi:glycosyltransferase involved in cell wall biosynthesis